MIDESEPEGMQRGETRKEQEVVEKSVRRPLLLSTVRWCRFRPARPSRSFSLDQPEVNHEAVALR